MPYITNIEFRDFGEKGQIKINAEIHNNKVEYDIYDYLHFKANFNILYDSITIVVKKGRLNLVSRIIGV